MRIPEAKCHLTEASALRGLKFFAPWLLPFPTDGTYIRAMPIRDGNLDAEADAALEAAKAMPPGPEKSAALKKAGLLRKAADDQGVLFAKRGRPPKS